MNFTQPLFLLLLPLLFYFILLGRPTGRYGRKRAWTALLLRCLLVTLVLLSLAGLQWVQGGTELSVVFVVDVSDSVSKVAQEQALAFVQEALAGIEPGDQAALVLFGADALVERPMLASDQLAEIASIPHTHQTDLEEAIRLGLALFPGHTARRMVLISDGNPTTGDTETAVRLAHAHGVQIDVVDVGTPPEAEAWLTNVNLPSRLHPGEEFTLSIAIESTDQMNGILTVLGEDQVLTEQFVHLNPGTNRFALPLIAGETGFTTFSVILTPSSDQYPQNNELSAFALVEGPPRVLMVANDLAETLPLQQALRATGLSVTESSPGGMPSDPAALGEYAAVILVNTPARMLSQNAMEAIQSFVRDLGGGLVAIGGPESYGVGGWYDTPLEETLPVEMTIQNPERFPPMSIIVIIDKSGSMSAVEGGVQKIRLAGEAAARVAELINNLDEITVIAFDDRPADVIGPLPGHRREEVIEKVIRLQAGGGGIYVRESLETALGILAESTNSVRHIILLADGSDSEHQQGVADMIQEEMVDQNITLSSVAIGTGQDLGFLQDIAELGNGRYYFTDRAANLPVIFAQETQLTMRTYIVEESFFPQQTASSPILTGIETVPQLLGYVATSSKPTAQTILVTHQEDPLLATWQYGLGRAVAWTSDTTGRWAQQWVDWDGFARFWAQIVRWTVVQQADVPVEMSIALDGETATITVDAINEDGTFVNGLETAVSLVGPDREAEQVDLVQTGPGQYQGTFEPQAEGAFLLRLTGSLAGEEAIALTNGWVLGYSPEYAALEKNPAYLAHLAELGGGRVLEEPGASFAHTLRGEGTAQALWPYLLALATLLLPLDIGIRRLVLGRYDLVRVWEAIRRRLPRRQPQPSPAPSPVSRLFEAKARAEPSPTSEDATTLPSTTSPQPAPTAPPPPSPTPKAQEKPVPPTPPPLAEGESLAGRLLRRKQERREKEPDNS